MTTAAELDAQLKKEQDAWLETWLNSQGSPSGGALYHYTDSSGLIGILESRIFRATNILHLNDRSEISYGVDLVRQRLNEAVKGKSGALPALLVRTKTEFNPFDILTVYVACFSELKDDLSQWRAYGRMGGGYSIGISPRIAHPPENAPKISLRRVIYEESQQAALIDAAIADMVRIADSALASAGAHDQYQMVERLIRFFKIRIGDYLWCFKNPAFKDEREWRFTYVGGPFGLGNRSPKFRPGAGGVIPYVELNLLDVLSQANERLVISEIVCGPTLHPEEARRTAMTLAQMTKHSGVQVSVSEVPLRR